MAMLRDQKAQDPPQWESRRSRVEWRATSSPPPPLHGRISFHRGTPSMTYQTLDLVGHFVVPGQGDRLLGEEGRQQPITRGILLRLDQQGIRLSWDTGNRDRVAFRYL